MLAEELAAAMRESPYSPLPTASDMLGGCSPSASSTNLYELGQPSTPARPPPTTPRPVMAPPSPPPHSPDISGSRLARRWLAGIKAREMIDAENEDDDSWTPSMLDLTKLCATSDERSPTSVLLPGDLAPFDDRVHPNIPAR